MPIDRRSDAIELDKLDQQLATADDGDVTALTQAVATYETQRRSAHESEDSDRYRDISKTYQERLVTVLDDTIQTEGWDLLSDFLDAYHPETADEFPHVTTVLQNITSRYLIRTRLSDGVEEIPVESLEFFSSILDRLDRSGYDYITEGMHPYGWGTGHPEHSVADNIHERASTDIFVVNPMLEHAFYADQQLAIDLLERIARDDSIQRTLSYSTDQISEIRYLLDAPAGAVSDFRPTMPRYWEWQDDLGYECELDEDMEERIRQLVAEHGIDDDLPSDWEIPDLTV